MAIHRRANLAESQTDGRRIGGKHTRKALLAFLFPLLITSTALWGIQNDGTLTSAFYM